MNILVVSHIITSYNTLLGVVRCPQISVINTDLFCESTHLNLFGKYSRKGLRPVLSVLLFALLFHVAFYFWCHNLSRTITRGKEKATPFWKKQQCFKDCQMTNL